MSWIRKSLGGTNFNVFQYDSSIMPYSYTRTSASITSQASLEALVSFLNSYFDDIASTDLVRQLYTKCRTGGTFNLKNSSDITVARVVFTTTAGLNVYYVTYETNGSRYNVQYSSNDYPAYVRSSGSTTYTCGLKFKVIVSGSASNVDTNSFIDLYRGTTRTVHKQILGTTVHIDGCEWFDTSGQATLGTGAFDLPGCRSAMGTVDIMGCTTLGIILGNLKTSKVDRLSVCQYAGDYVGGQPYVGYYEQLGVIDISNVVVTDPTPEPEPEPTEEDGYVNELMNRFSPRYWAGCLGIYLIPTSQIEDVMRAIMETDISDLLKNIFFGSDGKEYIISLKWYYGMLQIQNYGHYNGNIQMSADRKEIKCGSVALDLDENPLYAHIASTEFATWTSSEIMVPEYFENYLDFMCSYQLYIPYYGFLELSPNDVVGGTLQLIYNINIVSGIADIVVVCKNSRSDNKRTKYYTVNAQIGIDIPYGSDMMKTLGANWAQTCGKAFVTGAKMGNGAGTQDFNAYMKESNAAENNVLKNDNLEEATKLESIGNIRNTRDEALQRYRKAEFGNNLIQNGVNSINPIQSVTRSGSFNSETGNLDELHPYLLITKPVTAAPSDYEAYVGMPCSESVTLSNVTGFTQVAAVMPKTTYTGAPKYLNEIISQLQAGVYL